MCLLTSAWLQVHFDSICILDNCMCLRRDVCPQSLFETQGKKKPPLAVREPDVVFSTVHSRSKRALFKLRAHADSTVHSMVVQMRLIQVWPW